MLYSLLIFRVSLSINAVFPDPTGPATGSMRVLRGGSWYNFEAIVRVSNRGASNPTERLAIDGFRCAGNPDL